MTFMRTTRNSDDPKGDAVQDAISILKSMGFNLWQIGNLVISGRLMIQIRALNNGHEVGDVELDGVSLASYKL